MDRIVKCKYYRVSDREGGGLDFPEQLVDFWNRYPLALDREYRTATEQSQGSLIRLEYLDPGEQFIAGNFCRIQSENIPPEVTNEGLQPVELANGRGLGHQNAFLYHRQTRVLLWQQNRLGVSFADLAVYLNRDVDLVSLFAFEPIASEEAWDKFRETNPKKLVVKFAGQRYQQPPDDQVVPAVVGARDIAEHYNGLEAEISVSVGRSRTHFLDIHRISQTIRRMLLRDDLSKLQVHTDGDPEEKIIDFVEEHMQNIRELDLPSDNPLENYRRRRLFLQEAFNQRIEDLTARFDQME